MGKEQELNLKVDISTKNNELIITHREGKAPDIEVPQQVVFTGNIDSPGNYFIDRNKRKLINKDCSHVIINRRGGSITLIVNEESSKKTIITGVLKRNPDLENFGIWTKYYSHDEIIKFLRKNKRFFKDKEQFDNLMKSLSDFQFSREITGKIKNDRKGNIEDNFKQSVNQNVHLEFTLMIPLFEGMDAPTFHAELFPEITDGGNRWWIESVELLDLLESETDAILYEEEKRFTDILILNEN